MASVSADKKRVLIVEDEPDIVRGLSDALEFEGFMKLIHHPDTVARIEFMLENGKPLRN